MKTSHIINLILVLCLLIFGIYYYFENENFNNINKKNTGKVEKLERDFNRKNEDLEKKESEINVLKNDFKKLENNFSIIKSNYENEKLKNSRLENEVNFLKSEKKSNAKELENKETKILKANEPKILEKESEKKHFIEIKNVLKNKIIINDENEKSEIIKNEIKVKEDKKILVFVKKLEYKTLNLPLGISELTNFEKAKLTNAVKEIYENRKENQFIVIEGNADSLSYAKDPENYKNIDLAFKRALKAVFNLDEAKINNLYFKINTKANDRDVKIFICYYELKDS